MSSRLVDLLQDTIDKQRYELPQEGKHWILEGDIKLRDANRHSFAFTLAPNNTETKSKPLAFFNARPPEGIAKMCDAIVACHYNQRCYLLLIELKTAHKDEYQKQINNGKIFCEWLLKLYHQHGHCQVQPVFVSLLIWFPRRSPAKQGTAHQAAPWLFNTGPEKGAHGFDYSFEIQNQTTIPMLEVLQQSSGTQ